MRRLLWLLPVLCSLLALTGCIYSTVAVGKHDLRVRSGEWLGSDNDDHVVLEFNIVSVGDSGARIALLTYAYPCGGRSISVSTFGLGDMNTRLPVKKAEIRDGMFEVRVEQTDPLSASVFTPFVFTGEFIDGTHIDGTWEVFKHRGLSGETVCPAAKGTWRGRPK